MRSLLLLAAASLGLAAPAAGQLPLRPLVVIDAGHGGEDPGATGPRGLREKDVALDFGRRMADLLLAGGFDVRMTRLSDSLIPLHDRASMANDWKEADGAERRALFVSIHANAHERESVRGIETYFLSEALTEDAERLAALENSALRFEARSGDGSLDFILGDLLQNLYLRESSEAASILQRGLLDVHPGPDRGVKQARFVVLSGVRMPAVLLEIGFITNRQDEALLGNGDHLTRAAVRLRDSIVRYLEGSALRSEPVD